MNPACINWVLDLFPCIKELLRLLDGGQGHGDLLLGVGGEPVARDETNKAVNSDVQPARQYNMGRSVPTGESA